MSRFFVIGPHPETGEEMTWGNWGRGKGKWQIDHIEELQFFNLSDPEQFKRAYPITNLQPLWWDANIRKSMKLRPGIPFRKTK